MSIGHRLSNHVQFLKKQAVNPPRPEGDSVGSTTESFPLGGLTVIVGHDRNIFSDVTKGTGAPIGVRENELHFADRVVFDRPRKFSIS
jgi:hypothetical protein